MNPILLAALVVLATAVVGQLAGRVTTLIRMPAVVGEIAAGLLLIPAVSLVFGPPTVQLLLPPEARDTLATVGEIGLSLFLVRLGHELGGSPVTPRSGRTLALAAASFAVPFLGAFALAPILQAWHPGVLGVSGDPFPVVFLGTALAVTAVPVLARIVADLGIADRESARAAAAAAIVIDAVAWVTLVALISRDAADALVSTGIAVVALAGGAFALRRLLRLAAVWRVFERRFVGTVLIGALGFGAYEGTEALGFTGIAGAVAVGMVFAGRDRRSVLPCAPDTDRVARLLMPIYFVAAGIAVANAGSGLAVTLLLLGAAVLTKVGGTWVGARLTGFGRTDAVQVSLLMNTRGLTEIVFVQAGWQAGLLDERLLGPLIVIALVTSAMTGPAVRGVDALSRRARRRAAGDPGSRIRAPER